LAIFTQNRMQMGKCNAVLIFLTLLLGSGSTAQSDSTQLPTNILLEANFYRGAVLDIHPFFPETSTAYSYELNINGKTRGSSFWHQHHNFPEFGVAVSYNTFGNDSTLGSSIGALPNFSFRKPIGNKLGIKFRPGIGLAYFTSPFHAIDNPNNFVIGSRVTAMVRIEVNLDYPLTENLDLQVGGGITHYSNAHWSVPNIGMNVTTLSAGLRYYPKKRQKTVLKQHSLKLDNTWKLATSFTLGWHEIEGTVLPYDGPRYSVYGIQVYASKRFTYKNHFKVGVDLNYYTAVRDMIISQELFDSKEGLRSWKTNVFVGHDFFFGRFTFTTHFGANVYFPIRERLIELGLFEEKFLHLRSSNLIACHYYLFDTSSTLKNNPFIGLNLKAIGGKADFVGVSVGMAF
jgi:hypothetical protein